MPLAPTQALPPGGETTLGEPAVPTSPNPLATNVSGGGTRPQALDLAAPTERPPGMMPAEAGLRAASRGLDQSRTVQSTVNPNFVAPPVQPNAQKPFGGYQPTSGVSPYIEYLP